MTQCIGVKCPKYGEPYQADFCDGDDHLVTLWGEGGPVSVWCHACDAQFLVEEAVMRSWELVEP